jgi:phage terminase large subunit
MSQEFRFQLGRVFKPLLIKDIRYKGAYGGRGSGKSHFFGSLMVDECLSNRGTRAVCVREVQRTLIQSSKRLIENKILEFNLLVDGFKIWKDRIETPGDGVIIFQGMQDSTAESVKSLEGFRIAWIEEAQTLSARSLQLLRPTIRLPKSQIWANWNPRRKRDAIDEFLRQNTPDNAVVVKANWRDNPWFNETLEAERQLDQQLYPDRYPHIWDGEYARAFEGAYFAQHLEQARVQKRISRVPMDPVISVRAYFDIGGSGHNADATAIWIVQFVGREIWILDYIEGVGQPLGYYANELRSRGWKNAVIYLPHDGVAHNNITGKRYIDHWSEAGFECANPIRNTGVGAAMMRVEAARRIFPKCWFNAETTEAGRDALGYYHERRDSERLIGLGPDHDWSSHAADAFGYMAISYEEPPIAKVSSGRHRTEPPKGGTFWSA